MFCPKCGNQLGREEENCLSCGYELQDRRAVSHAIRGAKVNEIISTKPLGRNPNAKIIFLVLAGVVFAMSLYGAHCVATGGLDISGIQSVGGTTLEEAYYHHLGIVYTGYAATIRVIGIFFASVLVYLGIKG